MRTVQRMLSELDAWVARPKTRQVLCEEATHSLEGYLDGKLPSPIAALLNLAWWLGNSGANAVLHGDPAGWADVVRSLHYLAWNERTLLAMLDKRTARSVGADRSIFVVLHAMSAGQDDMAVWLGNRLAAAIQRPNKTIRGLATKPLHPFALHVFARWRGVPLEFQWTADPQLAIYKGVLNAWDDDRAFARHLVAAADYHVEQAFDDSDDQTQDFFHPLYRLFPVEFLAIRRVREDQRRLMPEIDHPLLQTRLAKPPMGLPPVKDELLEGVANKICKDFAISSPWK